MGAVPNIYLWLLLFAIILQFSDLKVPSPLIYGGDPVNITEAPFMAIFVILDYGFTCGAAIISPNILLSAAHCNIGVRKLVVVGTDLYVPTTGLNGKYYVVKTTYNHTQYNSNFAMNYDMCTIITRKKIIFGIKVKPISLIDATIKNKEGDLIKIYGFGKTKVAETSPILLMATLPFVEKSKCVKRWSYELTATDPSVFCAGGDDRDTCGGDSGGPAVYNGYLMGIISKGHARCGHLPALISHVPTMRNFIDFYMKKKFPEKQCQFQISGGSSVKITDAPFVATFKPERGTCSATIIHVRFLLATAHCLQNAVFLKRSLTITVGSDTYNGGQEYPVEAIFIHPKFDPRTYDFDLAVIKLKNYLTLSDKVKTIEIAGNIDLYPGLPVTVYGFRDDRGGYNDSLHKMDLPYYDWDTCRRLYEKTNYPITYQMFCAGEEEKENACAGDHGGAAIYHGVLLGITSWGAESCSRKYPSIFTYLPPLEAYINEIINNNIHT